MAIMNKKGERRSPCRMPLLAFIYPLGLPFRRIGLLTEDIQARIQLT